MNRTTFFAVGMLCLGTGLARAEQPARMEGLLVRLEGGYAQWALDAGRIQAQPGVPADEVQPALVDQTPAAPGAALELGYNIRGHVSLSASVSATGWDLFVRERGGGGFAAGLLTWHPLELIEPWRDRSFDVSFFLGGGYGVVGELRALDGWHLQAGARAEVFLARWLSLGASVRTMPLLFNRYVIDWDSEQFVPLPQGTGGSVLWPSLGLTVHAPLG